MTVPEQQILDGRKYFGNEKVAYLLPQDENEIGRLHKQHIVLKVTLQSNFHAPLQQQLEDGITVLDSGCGPGAWTFDMAETFPNSKFHGVDITSTFPEEKKPENCEFVIANITDSLPYPDNYFDYIHQRLLILGLTNANWDSALKELFRVLKPGGYIELHEPNLHSLVNMGPLLQKLHSKMTEMLQSRDIPPLISNELKDRVTEAGFVEAKVSITPLALNHNGRVGELLWEDYKHGYMNVKPFMSLAYPEWEDIEVYQQFIDTCADEAKENKTSINWYICVAQKPLE